MKKHIPHKTECDLKECRAVFMTKSLAHRFCCPAHKNKWHARERYRMVKLFKIMGVKR